MITLEEYKEYLINTYKYPIDNSDKKKMDREIYLLNHYKEEYLNKIIKDTSKLISTLLNLQDRNYYSIKMSDCNINYIFLDLTGGWHSDIIYEDADGNLISSYILQKIIGNQLIIEVKEIEIEFDTEDPDILSYDYEYYLYLQGIKKEHKKKILKK